jgi:catechol 2,3-dioxygenase-like lactoylglutathione lyase family enzyme
VINGAHVIIFSRAPEADRAFFADVMGFPHVDAGAGWLIFRLPPAELALHPADGPESHELYFMCDDITATITELTEKGVEFIGPVTDARWGRIARLRLPGGSELSIYEPLHPRATSL